jgi:hypothetical protein
MSPYLPSYICFNLLSAYSRMHSRSFRNCQLRNNELGICATCLSYSRIKYFSVYGCKNNKLWCALIQAWKFSIFEPRIWNFRASLRPLTVQDSWYSLLASSSFWISIKFGSKGNVYPFFTPLRHVGQLEVLLRSFLTSASDWIECSFSRPDRFNPGERSFGVHRIRGWLGSRTGLNAGEDTNRFSYRLPNHGFSDFQPVQIWHYRTLSLILQLPFLLHNHHFILHPCLTTVKIVFIPGVQFFVNLMTINLLQTLLSIL